MKKTVFIKWLAVWLALALTVPLGALGEAALTVEADCVEEAVPAVAANAIPEPVQDDGKDESADAGAVDEAVSGEVPVRLAQTKLTLGVKEKYKLTLEGGVSAKSAGAVFSSSNKKVATVDKTTGKVTAKKKGSATITMKAASGEVSTCKIKVKKAPSKVKLSSKRLTLGVGEEKKVKAKISSGSASAITYSSSNKKVAKVDGDGRIIAVKKGKAKITARTFNGKKAVCKVEVKAAPKSISLGKSSIALWEGDAASLSVKLNKNSAGSYELTSDDKSVVTVSGGKLKAVGVGTTVVVAQAYNGATAAMTVEVRRKPVYRALLVGECTFPGTFYNDLPAKKDVSLMKNMLKSTRGATKSKWSVTTRLNRTTAQIRKDIQSAFAGAQEGDVSLFYISTHGDQDNAFSGETSKYAGFLMTYPDDNYDGDVEQGALTLPSLASWLKQVPGQVIVIIDSCGSGAAIYGAKSNGSASARASASFAPGVFDNAVVNAFESVDKGVEVPGLEQGAFVLKNKFYVLTSAGYQEACWTDNGKYSYFTKWLTEGIGTKGRMPADTNKNKQTTLKELYKYIQKRSEKSKIKDSKGKSYQQHVQVYPAGSGFELFYRK